MKVFVVDVAKCNGCFNCQVACKDEFVENEWLPYSLPQPDVGQFWVKVEQTTHGQVPKVNVEYQCQPCMHCDNAPCMKFGDAVYKNADGIVIIDPVKAKGKKEIVASCPYGKIFWNEEHKVAQKCTGCVHLTEDGRPPRCVEACMTDALHYGEEKDLKDLINKSEVLKPELGTKPRVYYMNLPKLFAAGTVYDPDAEEIIEKAKVRLTPKSAPTPYTTLTDGFGDFWFKRMAPGDYTLEVEKYGYKKIVMDVKLDKSLNVGDLQMKKA